MDIVKEIKESFKEGSMLTKLVYINIGVYVLTLLLGVILFFMNRAGIADAWVMNWFAVPANVSELIQKPWTFISYMFLHFDFLHILFNLLWLYWFGKVFLLYYNEKQMVGVYLLGGIAGALFYIFCYNIFPVFADDVYLAKALGASAAVMAVAFAISTRVPDYTFNLMFIGPVKIKYIAIVFVLTDVLSIPKGNAGGHIAHLGGAMMGYLFTLSYQKGFDLTKWINKIIDFFVTIFKPRPKIKITHQRKVDDYEYNYMKKSEQDRMDEILDKIARSGYDSLSKEDNETLFKMRK